MHRRIPLTAASLAAIAAALAASGCGSGSSQTFRDTRPINRWAIDHFTDAAVENAITAQRTLYPYHFFPGSPELNDLGRRDLSILIAHLGRAPGPISIRRGSEHANIYNARLDTVAAALAGAGVPTHATALTDAPPAAGALESRRAALILLRTDEPLSVQGVQKGITGQ